MRVSVFIFLFSFLFLAKPSGVLASSLPWGLSFVSPVSGGDCRVTGGFGNRRHPFTGQIDNHGAYDFAGPGLQVRAAASGVVTESTSNGTCGEYVEIRHAGNVHTYYCHLARGSRRVSKGASVSAGQHIGTVGSTGRSTGPHLHWVVKMGPGFDSSRRSHIDPMGKLISQSEIGCSEGGGAPAARKNIRRGRR